MNRRVDKREIIINARKYDGSIRRSWTASVVSETEDLVIALGRFDRDVIHRDLGTIKKNTISFEYFWLDRWYNIFRFHEPDGSFRNYYCNIAMPAVLSEGELDFVDLDVDVVVWPEKRVEILDREDFDENAIRFGYSASTVERVEESLDDILKMVKNDELP